MHVEARDWLVKVNHKYAYILHINISVILSHRVSVIKVRSHLGAIYGAILDHGDLKSEKKSNVTFLNKINIKIVSHRPPHPPPPARLLIGRFTTVLDPNYRGNLQGPSVHLY